MNCLHCGSALVPHDTEFGAKRDALHCYGCNCCFLKDGKTQREGIPACDRAQAPEESAPSLPVEPEPVVTESKPVSAPRRAR